MIILCNGYLARFKWFVFWFFWFRRFDGIMTSFLTPLSSRILNRLQKMTDHHGLTGMFKNSVKSVLLFLQHDHPYYTTTCTLFT